MTWFEFYALFGAPILLGGAGFFVLWVAMRDVDRAHRREGDGPSS